MRGVSERALRAQSRGPEETEALGAQLAARLAPGDVVFVEGDLGAGKTTFVRGACRALGVSDAVTSPTFTIGASYSGREAEVAHLDLYRLAGLGEEDPGMLADYVSSATITFMEWPEHGGDALAQATFTVTLEHAGEDLRDVTIVQARGRPAGSAAEQRL